MIMSKGALSPSAGISTHHDNKLYTTYHLAQVIINQSQSDLGEYLYIYSETSLSRHTPYKGHNRNTY